MSIEINVCLSIFSFNVIHTRRAVINGESAQNASFIAKGSERTARLIRIALNWYASPPIKIVGMHSIGMSRNKLRPSNRAIIVDPIKRTTFRIKFSSMFGT